MKKRLFYPKGITGALVAIFEEYVDEWIARTALHFRWNNEEGTKHGKEMIGRDLLDSKERKSLSLEQLKEKGIAIGEFVQTWGKRACMAVGVATPLQQRKCEEELERILTNFEKHLQQGSRFLLGYRPSAFDAVLFGGFEAHFFFDPAPKKRFFNKGKYPKFIETYEWNLSQGKTGSLNSQVTGKTHQLVDVRDLPQFFKFFLEEISEGPFSSYLDMTKKNYNQKSFEMECYGEKLSFKTRKYVADSLRELNKFISNHLSSQDALKFNTLMKQYKLDHVFSANASRI